MCKYIDFWNSIKCDDWLELYESLINNFSVSARQLVTSRNCMILIYRLVLVNKLNIQFQSKQ